jgi:uncharacterized protein with PIN domain
MVGNDHGKDLLFIVDHNVGKLVRWLRMLGYDSVFFNGPDDGEMVKQALAEGRIILTRDTGITKRRVVKNGEIKVTLLESENPHEQMSQILSSFDINSAIRPFTRCLECNRPLESRAREDLANRIPPYVYRTQSRYVECPGCHRIYWKGTHWQAMMKKIEKLDDISRDSSTGK